MNDRSEPITFDEPAKAVCRVSWVKHREHVPGGGYQTIGPVTVGDVLDYIDSGPEFVTRAVAEVVSQEHDKHIKGLIDRVERAERERDRALVNHEDPGLVKRLRARIRWLTEVAEAARPVARAFNNWQRPDCGDATRLISALEALDRGLNEGDV